MILVIKTPKARIDRAANIIATRIKVSNNKTSNQLTEKERDSNELKSNEAYWFLRSKHAKPEDRLTQKNKKNKNKFKEQFRESITHKQKHQ